MLRLLSLGRWEHAGARECFIKQGDVLDRLMLICAGKARVVEDGKEVGELGDGQFIGGIPFISEQAAPANVVAVEETHYMSWPKMELKEFLKENPELHAALQLTLGYDLALRIEAAYKHAASPS